MLSDFFAPLKVKIMGIKVIEGYQVDGFKKAFDNGKIRIYKVLP